MSVTEQAQATPYELILTEDQLPTSEDEIKAALEQAAEIMAANQDISSSDQLNLRARATANVDQILDGQVNPDALTTVRKRLAKLAGVEAY